MKRFLIFIALAMILGSCATRAHCDAYGEVEAKENSTEEKA